ncbi:MAG: two-component sensor histidine kinase [Desulfobacterales bacterium]|nr:two-component sensor histidine kinase [Desulfobacterales bacterium]MCF8078688.1 two-component sensor histidine kinase [Desulfobacterales bacterium]
MGFIEHLKPVFWEQGDPSRGIYGYRFNFRRIWKLTVWLTLAVTIIPLVVMTVIDYRVSKAAMESEILLRTSRLVSNTRRSVFYFLNERMTAIDFVIQNDSYRSLKNQDRLEQVLAHLKKSFGGFLDLGVIDSRGIQITYAGPYALTGRQYKEADWFKEVVQKGIYLSDVFLGYRNVPHMVIAVKHESRSEGFYVLRATVDMNRLNNLLIDLEVGGDGDAFLINRQGVLQTPSRNHGSVLGQIELEVPPYSEHSQVRQILQYTQGPLVIGYAYIAPDTPFILMIVKEKDRLMGSWKKSRTQMLGFLAGSVLVIVLVILGGSTYLVNQIYLADKRRLMAVHQMEYANKMASLGRMSAGVAHEINNPLAIISEKAGLMRDLLVMDQKCRNDPKLVGLIDSVLAAVDRCSDITRRLLSFARHSGAAPKELDLEDVVREVLGFVGKEAEYRCLDVTVEKADDVPAIVSDRGRLQEIFLNLINNAFAAVDDGGRMAISIERYDEDKVMLDFADDGHGIPKEDLERIYEPFFSTRIGKGGTGLGLSITYGLVQELGGSLSVKSQVGKGTTFTIVLPARLERSESDQEGTNPCGKTDSSPLEAVNESSARR